MPGIMPAPALAGSRPVVLAIASDGLLGHARASMGGMGTLHEDDYAARLAARQAAEDLAYIQVQWGSLYAVYADNGLWVAHCRRTERILCDESAEGLLRQVRAHYSETQRVLNSPG